MVTEKIQLDADEQILAQVRKHWFVFAMQIFGIILTAILPLLLYVVFTTILTNNALAISINTNVLVALYTAWLLVMWMGLFNIWTNYYLDVWTITTKRLIAVDQRGLFYRNTGSFRLERLQDINVSVQGLLPTFLDYGDLQAETASEDREFVARGIPHPQELKALILNASDAITFTNQGAQQTAAAPQQVNDGL